MRIQRFKLSVPPQYDVGGFTPSFGSGLGFQRKLPDGTVSLFAVSDRGPNGDGPMAPHPAGGLAESKIFPAPEFVPSIAHVEVNEHGARVTSVTRLRGPDGEYASGLPRPPGAAGHSGEVPLNAALRIDPENGVGYRRNGIDPEGIAFDAARNCLWIADDYGPFLMRVEIETGTITETYGPGTGLPAIFSQRAPNRGIEGITLDPATGMLYVFVQSPLLADGGGEPDAPFLRWACFDPDQRATVGMYDYPLEAQLYKNGRTREAKLGDFAALGDGKFVVIEQGKGPDGTMFHYLVLAGMDGTGTLRKQLLADLGEYGWQAEKAEGLCLVDPCTLAIASDNDFGLQTILVDADGQQVHDVDVSDCEVDAHGRFVGAAAGRIAAARIVPADAADLQVEIWLLTSETPFASAADFLAPAVGQREYKP